MNNPRKGPACGKYGAIRNTGKGLLLLTIASLACPALTLAQETPVQPHTEYHFTDSNLPTRPKGMYCPPNYNYQGHILRPDGEWDDKDWETCHYALYDSSGTYHVTMDAKAITSSPANGGK